MDKLLRIFSDEFNWKVGTLLIVLSVGYGLRELDRPGDEANRENLNILELRDQLPLSDQGGRPESLALIREEAQRR